MKGSDNWLFQFFQKRNHIISERPSKQPEFVLYAHSSCMRALVELFRSNEIAVPVVLVNLQLNVFSVIIGCQKVFVQSSYPAGNLGIELTFNGIHNILCKSRYSAFARRKTAYKINPVSHCPAQKFLWMFRLPETPELLLPAIFYLDFLFLLAYFLMKFPYQLFVKRKMLFCHNAPLYFFSHIARGIVRVFFPQSIVFQKLDNRSFKLHIVIGSNCNSRMAFLYFGFQAFHCSRNARHSQCKCMRKVP